MDRLFYYLNTLDDDYYFFIANTVLGQVKTPFHKPVINNAILSFLLNPQNRENITASLDNDDRRYLTLIDTVGGTTAALVSSFFDDRSYLLALTALESLRDRLLLLRMGKTTSSTQFWKTPSDLSLTGILHSGRTWALAFRCPMWTAMCCFPY